MTVRVRHDQRTKGLLLGSVTMLDDPDQDGDRLDPDDLRSLIGTNARAGLPLAFDDEKIATVLRRG